MNSDKTTIEDRILSLPCPRFTFDRVRILTTVPKRSLCQRLPVSALRQHCPTFRVVEAGLNNCGYRSAVEFTYPPAMAFWSLFAANEGRLDTYAITRLELAFDFPATGEFEAQQMCLDVSQCIRKPWHQRKGIRIYDPNLGCPAGVIPGPTFYFEDRRSRTALKLYCRYEKTGSGHRHDRPLARMEWTLSGAAAIAKKTGITRITQIQDPEVLSIISTFRERHLCLEVLNFERLGKWIDPRFQHPRVAAGAYLRRHAFPIGQAVEDDYDALHQWQSAAQVRGHLRNERLKVKSTPGRRSPWQQKLSQLTDYRLRTFFDPIIPPWLR